MPSSRNWPLPYYAPASFVHGYWSPVPLALDTTVQVYAVRGLSTPIGTVAVPCITKCSCSSSGYARRTNISMCPTCFIKLVLDNAPMNKPPKQGDNTIPIVSVLISSKAILTGSNVLIRPFPSSSIETTEKQREQ